MDISVLGIDIAKEVFQLHGADNRGKAVLRKRVRRSKLIEEVSKLPHCVIGMEACGGAHHWAREFRKAGHEVRLIAGKHVKPYVKSQKNDSNDAEAIAEAVSRPTMRFVPVKSIEQQDLQALHRVRERLVKSRTALSNEIRGLLMEYGIVLPKGISRLRRFLREELCNQRDALTSFACELFQTLREEFEHVEQQINHYDDKLVRIAKTHPESQRLLRIPGIGPLTATALISAVGDINQFKNGRHFAAWVGLVPQQASTGGKPRLLGISKRGNKYLRRLLVHGAHATIRFVTERTDRRSLWIQQLVARRGKNKTAVALANKNLRIAWVLMARNQEYQAAA